MRAANRGARYPHTRSPVPVAGGQHKGARRPHPRTANTPLAAFFFLIIIIIIIILGCGCPLSPPAGKLRESWGGRPPAPVGPVPAAAAPPGRPAAADPAAPLPPPPRSARHPPNKPLFIRVLQRFHFVRAVIIHIYFFLKKKADWDGNKKKNIITMKKKSS